MNRSFDAGIKEEIRTANPIKEVVSQYVTLKQTGRNYKGLCPFHSEKTPSFVVSPDKEMFYCFGCHAHGDVFDFIMKIENYDFFEALKFLGERVGIRVEPMAADPGIEAKRREREQLYKALQGAVSYYRYMLTTAAQGARGRNYLSRRGLDAAICARFNLGYALPGWDGLYRALNRKGFPDAILERAGLIIKRNSGDGYYDRFRDRIIFPIHDHMGRPIGFGGRIIDDGQPKYLNSPETEVFQKNRILYGLHLAKDAIRREQRAVIVEGYMDVVSAHAAGLENVVASLGTSLTVHQVQLLARFCHEVIIGYDGDAAGQAATLRGLKLLSDAGVRVRVLDLPGGHDPDSFIRENGVDGFRELLDSSPGLIDYRLDKILGGSKIDTIEDKTQTARRCIEVLCDISDPLMRAEYLRKVAFDIGFDENLLRSEVNSTLRQMRITGKGIREDTIEKNRNNNDMRPFRVSGKDLIRRRTEETLIENLLNRPEGIHIVSDIDGEDFSDEGLREIFLRFREWMNSGQGRDINRFADSLGSEETRRRVIGYLMDQDEMEDRERALRDCARKLKELSIKEKILRLQDEVALCENRGDIERSKELLQEISRLQSAINP